MKLNFTATADQSVDRLFIQAKETKWYLKEKILSCLLVTSIASIAIYLTGKNSPTYSSYLLIFSIIFFFICGAIMYDENLRRVYKKEFLSEVGEEKIEASYEITDEGLIFKTSKQTETAYWKNLLNYKIHKRFLELKFTKHMTALIHNEIFDDQETKEAWFKELKKRCNQTLTTKSTE